MSSGIEARRIAYSLASGQLGMIARRQLKLHSLADNLIDDWLRGGYMLKVVPGVYTLGRAAEDEASLWMAGVLLGGPNAVLAGDSAASSWNISKPSRKIEVVRSCGMRRTVSCSPPHQSWSISLRKAVLHEDDTEFKGPVPVMSPARLLMDLAGSAGSRDLRRRFIESGRQGLLTHRCLDAIKERSRDFSGSRELLVLAGNWDPSTGKIKSILEGEFKLMCAEQLVPQPLTNQHIGPYEVDCLFKREKLVVELDGRQFHGDAFALEADSEKTRYLRSLGYRVLRFTWADVTGRPEWVAARIREALGSSYPAMSGVN